VPNHSPDDAGKLALALYVHLPFCDHKCAYCDFNSYAGLDHLIPAYTEALIRDIALWQQAAAHYIVTTIFFGGGTPSLTPLPQLQRILTALCDTFRVAAGAEISLEANPGTVDQPYLAGLRGTGVNRLSLGVQSFDDTELHGLDRIHNGAQAIAAYGAARSAGFDNVNLDLIFGLSDQGTVGWHRNLQRAVELGPEHLSVYALTVEDGTKLARQVRQGTAPEPDADLQADMYEATDKILAKAGYELYEISNWSRPGRRCRHNLVYWRNEPYLGIGAGAHSSFLGHRFAAVTAPAAYMERVHRAADGQQVDQSGIGELPQIASDTVVDALTDASDSLILGLRLTEGVDLCSFAQRHGAALAASVQPLIEEMTAWGLLERGQTRVRLTPRGRLLANEVFVRLLPEGIAAAGARVDTATTANLP